MANRQNRHRPIENRKIRKH